MHFDSSQEMYNYLFIEPITYEDYYNSIKYDITTVNLRGPHVKDTGWYLDKPHVEEWYVIHINEDLNCYWVKLDVKGELKELGRPHQFGKSILKWNQGAGWQVGAAIRFNHTFKVESFMNWININPLKELK